MSKVRFDVIKKLSHVCIPSRLSVISYFHALLFSLPRFLSSFFLLSPCSSINLKLIHDRVVMAHQQNETFTIKIGEFSSTASAKYIKHQSRKEKSTPKHGPIAEA